MERSPQVGRLRREGILLDVLTADDVKDIHYATLEVLERTGVYVEDDEALDIFADGGCDVDREERRVRIPPHVVEDAIASAPATVYGSGRDGVGDGLGQVGRVDWANFSEGIRYVDPWTGEWRESTKADVCDVARVVDALDWISSYTAGVGALDAPEPTAHLHGVEAALLNTCKPISAGVVDAWELRKCWELAAIVDGRRGRAAQAPDRQLRRLLDQPAEAAARGDRPNHRERPPGRLQHADLDGAHRRHGADVARRHAGGHQQRPAGGARAGAARQPRARRSCTAPRPRPWTCASRARRWERRRRR